MRLFVNFQQKKHLFLTASAKNGRFFVFFGLEKREGRRNKSGMEWCRQDLVLLTKWRADPFCGKIVIGGMQHDGTPKQTNGNDFRGY